MRKDIMLCFLSDVKMIPNTDKISIAEYQNIGKQKDCHTTNESAVRYLLCGGNARVDSLSHLFLVRTKMVAGPIAGYEDAEGRGWTHYGYFLHRISDVVPNVEDIADSIDFDEQAPIEENMDTLIEVASSVRRYAQDVRRDDPTVEIVLHVDCTGGLRNASMILVALMRLLQYERISIGKVLYSNYNRNDPNKNRVEEVNPLYSFFDLVAGAEEFVRHGEVSVMSDFFKGRATSEALDDLLDAMRSFAEELKLCHYGDLRNAIVELRRTIEAFPDESPASASTEAVQSDNLMRQMLGRIQDDYRDILKAELDDIALIRWCVSHNLLQQAMTLFTERVPEVLVASHFFRIDPRYQESFEEEWAKDSMNRSAAFYLINEYRKPAASEHEEASAKKRDNALLQVRKQWKKEFSAFVRDLRVRQEEEIRRFVEGALEGSRDFRLRTPEILHASVTWLWKMLQPHACENLRETSEGQRFLRNVRPLYLKARLPQGGAAEGTELEALERDIWDKLLAGKDGMLASKLVKFLSSGGVRVEDFDDLFMAAEWKPGVRLLREGGFIVQEAELAQRILTYYFDIKSERNHTSHARMETGRMGVKELKRMMETALLDIEQARQSGGSADA